MRVWISLYLIVIAFASWGQARRAENLIEKEKYDNAYEVLLNGMEKDSADASLSFVLAELYLTEAWLKANLDSAFYFSVQAIEKYDLLDVKDLDKHIKNGFGKTRLVELKENIDRLSFERAKAGGKEKDYQQFIDQHGDALDMDSAIYLRNEQAFLKASSHNSRVSYKYFLDHYKGAKDWQEADARYQKIVYDETTSSGKLKEYLYFINSSPTSPYYEDAVNEIYLIKAGENNTKTLVDFVDNYPTTTAAQKAIGLLYHIHLENNTASSFVDKYPKIQISDSLKRVIAYGSEALIPTWGGGFIQFFDLNQNVVIDSLTSIDTEQGFTDFISAQKGEKQVLMGKWGQAFYEGSWQSINDLGFGYIALHEDKKTSIVHKNGTHFKTGEEVKLVGPFVGFRTNDKWGLLSVTGKNISPAQYDSLWFQNGLVFIEQQEKTSPNLAEVFYPALDGEDYTIGSFYKEYEWLSDTLLWVAGNNKEGLLNNKLEPLVPFQKQRIDLAKKGWTITRKNKVQNPEFSELALDSFLENKNWQIGLAKDSLIVEYNYTTTFHPDSAFLLGPSSIEMNWADSTFVYLTDSIRIYTPEESTLRPLLDQTNSAAFYEFSEAKDVTVFNSTGQKLDLPEYSELSPLSPSFFMLKEDELYDLYNLKGEKLLDDLEGAALVNDSTLSILKEQQFGLFCPKDSLYLPPQFEKKPFLLADSLWAFSKNNLFGIISSSGHEVLPSIYEEIHYWTNGLLFLKKDLKWNLYDIKANRFPETGIIKYHSVTGNNVPMIIYQKGVGTGVFDSAQGIVLRPTFTSIVKKGTAAQPYYLADKQVEEASLHVLLYYDLEGKQLFKKVISDKQYQALFGEKE